MNGKPSIPNFIYPYRSIGFIVVYGNTIFWHDQKGVNQKNVNSDKVKVYTYTNIHNFRLLSLSNQTK